MWVLRATVVDWKVLKLPTTVNLGQLQVKEWQPTVLVMEYGFPTQMSLHVKVSITALIEKNQYQVIFSLNSWLWYP